MVGYAGLDAIKRERPDLVLLDLRMPDLSGIEVLERVRDVPEWRDIPFVVVSASVLRDEEKVALEAGARAFVRKPINESQLLECIKDVIGVRYVYAGNQTDPVADVSAFDDSGENVVDLVLLSALKDAALGGDIMTLNKLMPELEGSSPALTQNIRLYLDNYDYEAIISLLEARIAKKI